jgi:hypothetical protein
MMVDQRTSIRNEMSRLHRQMKEQVQADSVAMAKVMQDASDLRENKLLLLKAEHRSIRVTI